MNDTQLRNLFEIFDQNRNGHIERNELKALLIAVGESPSDSRVDKLVNIL